MFPEVWHAYGIFQDLLGLFHLPILSQYRMELKIGALLIVINCSPSLDRPTLLTRAVSSYKLVLEKTKQILLNCIPQYQFPMSRLEL